jgi:hypothetical protein
MFYWVIDSNFLDKLIILGIPHEPWTTTTTFKIDSSTPAQLLILDPKNKYISQICAQKAGSFKVCPPKIGPFKMGAHKIGSFKVGTPNAGSFKVGTPKIDPFKVGTVKIDPFEV